MSTRLRIHTLLRRYLQRYGEPPREHVTDAVERVWQAIETDAAHTAPGTTASAFTVASALRRKPRDLRERWIPLAAAAVVVIAAVGTAIVWRPADNALFRVAEGEVHDGEGAIRSNGGGGGAVLVLTDGSRVEMRSQSELSLERADDGLRIRLIRGGIIVDATTQRAGHLYVQTKDVTVSVVGTVFLVNADEQGSRVAVIEGEVRVQQGATAKTLLPGDQVASSAAMQPQPVIDEIAWSRNAALHRALLLQATTPAIQLAQPAGAEAFEEITIRPAAAVAAGGARGGGDGRPFVVRRGNAAGCNQGEAQIDPRRFAYFGVTAYTLIVHAYGKTRLIDGGSCMDTSRIAPVAGGSDWVRSDQWDIQATMPQGSTTDVESVRRKIRALLASRFGLEMRTGTKDVAAYALTLAGSPSRYAPVPDGPTWLTDKERLSSFVQFLPPDYRGVGNNQADGPPYLFFGKDASMADLVNVVARLGGRPVLDRTGLKAQYNFAFDYEIFPDAQGETGGILIPLNDPTWSSFRRELERQLGFRLEDARSVIDAHTIVKVERPSEN